MPTSTFWEESEVFELTPGPERTKRLKEIVIEVLDLVNPGQPTKPNLQRLCKIRKTRFLKVLRELLETGDVVKSGRGTKASPFIYKLRKNIK